LKAALEDPAAQILWQIEENDTEKQIIDLLRNRFGDLSQQERYRAQLYSRKRKKGESAQSLCFDIRRLLALSFPGETGKMVEIVGRDCFLNSLNDINLRIKVLELQPVSMDEALNHVCRLESYRSLFPGGVEKTSAPEERNRVRAVRPEKPVNLAPTTERGHNPMEQKIKQLETEQISLWRKIKQASADAQFWRERALATESAGWGPRPGFFNRLPPMQLRQLPFSSQPPPGQIGTSGGHVKRAVTPMLSHSFRQILATAVVAVMVICRTLPRIVLIE